MYLHILAVLKHFLGASHVPGLGLGTEDTWVGSRDEALPSGGFRHGGCRAEPAGKGFVSGQELKQHRVSG